MAYIDHFQLADDYINHIGPAISAITDPFILSRYTGFLSISAVTVYELAIKTIFNDFAEKKHEVFGVFAYSHFRRLNGNIQISKLRGDHIKSFGEKYLNKFDRKIEAIERDILVKEGVSVKSSYENIITWRNKFAHTGVIPETVTFEEARQSYFIGKNLIICLNDAMSR